MSLWGDDQVDPGRLRPSPAAHEPATGATGEVAPAARPAGARLRDRAPAAAGRTVPVDRTAAIVVEPAVRWRQFFRGGVIGVILLGTLATVGAALLRPGRPAEPVRTTAGRSQPQLPAPGAAATLAHPVAVSLDPPPARPERCPDRAGLRCAPPSVFLSVDEVTAVRSEDRGTGALVRLSLTTWDATTLAGVARNGTRVTARVGGGTSAPAAIGPDGTLVLPVEDRAAAVSTVAALGLVAVPRARLGKGALDRPLELWTVRASRGPCRTSAVPGTRGLLVVDRGTECLELGGPSVRLRSVADLTLTRPNSKAPYWVLSVVSAEADRPALARFTREQARTKARVAFVVGGHVVTGQPVVTAEASAGVELGLADEAEARLLAHRLRS